MAKIRTQGLDSFTTQLSELADEVRSINRLALGQGAKIVADEVGKALQSLPVRSDKEFGTEKHKLYGATASEKRQIIDNFGITRFDEKNGGQKTSVGFTGYVNTKSKRFNDNVPTGMLVQCINYGTDFRQGTHTISNAINSIKSKVPQVIEETITNETKKIIK